MHAGDGRVGVPRVQGRGGQRALLLRLTAQHPQHSPNGRRHFPSARPSDSTWSAGTGFRGAGFRPLASAAMFLATSCPCCIAENAAGAPEGDETVRHTRSPHCDCGLLLAQRPAVLPASRCRPSCAGNPPFLGSAPYLASGVAAQSPTAKCPSAPFTLRHSSTTTLRCGSRRPGS